MFKILEHLPFIIIYYISIYMYSLHAGLSLTHLLLSADFFKFNFFKNYFRNTIRDRCQTVWIQIKTDILLLSENPEYSVMQHTCDMVDVILSLQ